MFPPRTRGIWQVGSVKGSGIISCSHGVHWAQLDGSSAPHDVSWACNLQGAQVGWNIQDGILSGILVGTAGRLDSAGTLGSLGLSAHVVSGPLLPPVVSPHDFSIRVGRLLTSQLRALKRT